MRKRDLDWLRTTYVLLVVVGHSMGAVAVLIDDKADLQKEIWRAVDNIYNFHMSMLFAVSGEVASTCTLPFICNQEYLTAQAFDVGKWYVQEVVIRKGKRLLFPYFVVGFLFLDKLALWMIHFDQDFLWVFLNYWHAPVSWFLVVLYVLFVINGFWLGGSKYASFIWVLSVTFLVVIPWSSTVSGPWWITAVIFSVTFLAPYFVLCFQRNNNIYTQICVIAFSNLGLQFFLKSRDQQPYWMHRVISYNHFFLMGTLQKEFSLEALGLLPLLVCSSTIQPTWDIGYWSAFGRWLHSWSWVIMSREICRGFQQTDSKYWNEDLLHESGMYIYLLHTPIMHGLKLLLWQHMHPYWTIFFCSLIPVIVSISVFYCSQLLQRFFANKFHLYDASASTL